jgi:hypothetical protein
VLSESTLFTVETGQNSIKAEALKDCSGKVALFVVNEYSKTHSTEVVVITKKKEGLVL